MEKEVINKDLSLRENLQNLQKEGYEYIVKATDKIMSGWGNAKGESHYQLVACKNSVERARIEQGFNYDKEFNRVTWYSIKNELDRIIKNYNSKSHTLWLDSDWTRF